MFSAGRGQRPQLAVSMSNLRPHGGRLPFLEGRSHLRPVLSALLVVSVLLLAFAAPVLGHAVVVDAPGHSEPKAQWVGGPNVPGKGQGLMPNPFGLQPPSHGKGLVNACHATLANPSAVVILAPPYFTGCQHGQP
jgi:hypothetical protein